MSMSLTAPRASARRRFRTALAVGASTALTLVAAPSALATTPTISAPATYSVSQTGQNVPANINTYGEDATIRVDWGTTTSYGSFDTESYTLSGTGQYSTWFELRSLTPGTIYNYKLTVTTDEGTATTANKQFVTAAAPTIEDLGSVAVGTTGQNVTTRVNPFGKNAAIKIDWGTTTSYGNSETENYTPGTEVNAYATWFELRNLTPGQTYNYRITVTTSQGSVVSANKQFVIAAPPTITSTSSTKISATQHNTAATIDTYGLNGTITVEYGTTPSVTSSQVENYTASGPGPYVTWFEHAGLTTGTTYYYRYKVTTAKGTVTSATKTFVAGT